jgi:hypothetical protein
MFFPRCCWGEEEDEERADHRTAILRHPPPSRRRLMTWHPPRRITKPYASFPGHPLGAQFVGIGKKETLGSCSFSLVTSNPLLGGKVVLAWNLPLHVFMPPLRAQRPESRVQRPKPRDTQALLCRPAWVKLCGTLDKETKTTRLEPFRNL